MDVYLESPDDEPREYGVTIGLTGTGTVKWSVTAPSPWDLELFAGHVEGDTAGGGFIHDVDTSDVQIAAYGTYRPSDDAWRDVELERANQDVDEADRRTDEHQRSQTRLEQELGLLPTDDQIEAWETTRTRGGAPRIRRKR